MLALALTFPLFVALDTLVFDDGTTHLLDETQVTAADDIIVRGPAGVGRTHAFLVNTARAGEISVRFRGTAGLRDQSSLTGDVTLYAPTAQFNLADSGTVEGTLDVRYGGAFLTGDGSVGAVDVALHGSVSLGGDVAIQGDLNVLGDVELNGGHVFGSTTLRNNLSYEYPATEFHGALTTDGYMSARFTDKRFGGDVTVQGWTHVEVSGASEIAGTLRVREQASVILFVNSADVPAGFLQATSGVFLALDSNGDHVFYSYERHPSASILIVRADDPASSTVCTQSSLNSTGLPGHTEALGDTRTAVGELVLRATDLPTNSFCFFFVGTSLVPATAPSGDLCAGGNIGRFVGPGQIMNTGQTGSITLSIDTSAIPGNPPSAATPGSTYYFQCWNRDNIGGAPASRFTDTAAVTFR